jgi:hypothetical protein
MINAPFSWVANVRNQPGGAYWKHPAETFVEGNENLLKVRRRFTLLTRKKKPFTNNFEELNIRRNSSYTDYPAKHILV